MGSGFLAWFFGFFRHAQGCDELFVELEQAFDQVAVALKTLCFVTAVMVVSRDTAAVAVVALFGNA